MSTRKLTKSTTIAKKRLAKGWGEYLLYNKGCYIFVKKGKSDSSTTFWRAKNVIVTSRNKHSQKPKEIYELAKALVGV